MADKFDRPSKASPNPPGPKKAAPANSRLEQAQKRAQAMAKSAGSTGGSRGDFFREAWVELKKTTWPSKDVTTKSTTVVLALVAATAIYVGALDFVFSKVLNPLFSGH